MNGQIISKPGTISAEDIAACLRGISDPAAKAQVIREYLEAVKTQRVAAGKNLDYSIGLTRNGDAVFYGPARGRASPVRPDGEINRNVIMVTRDGRVYQLSLEGVSMVNPKFKYPIVEVDLKSGRAIELLH